MSFSRREMTLILVAAALALGLTVYFVIAQLGDYRAALAAEVGRKEVLLDKVTRISRELARSEQRRQGDPRRKPLIGYVEELAARNGLKDRIQLNLVPMEKGRGVEAINVKLDNLSLDELVAFIYAVENSKPVLVVDQLEITNSFRSQDQLRLSARVLAQQ